MFKTCSRRVRRKKDEKKRHNKQMIHTRSRYYYYHYCRIAFIVIYVTRRLRVRNGNPTDPIHKTCTVSIDRSHFVYIHVVRFVYTHIRVMYGLRWRPVGYGFIRKTNDNIMCAASERQHEHTCFITTNPDDETRENLKPNTMRRDWRVIWLSRAVV